MKVSVQYTALAAVILLAAAVGYSRHVNSEMTQKSGQISGWSYYNDASGDVPPRKVLDFYSGNRFSPFWNNSFVRGTLWIHFEISGENLKPELNYYLEYPDPRAGMVELYKIYRDNVSLVGSNDLHSSSMRHGLYPSFVLYHDQGIAGEYLLAVSFRQNTGGPVFTNLKIWNESGFLVKQNQQILFIVLILGGLLFASFLSFLGFLMVRESYLFYFSLMLFSFLCILAIDSGVVLLIQYPVLGDFRYSTILYGIYILCAALFSKSFLKISMETQWASKLLLFAGFWGVTVVLAEWNGFSVVSFALSEGVFLVYLLLALVSFTYNRKSARLTGLAWIVLSIASFVSGTARDFGFIGNDLLFASAIYPGIFIHILLIAIAMSLRLGKIHSEKEQAMEEARTDFLTGVANRMYFIEQSLKIISFAKRNNTSLCLLILDIDYFKKVNDSYGHDAGDEVLKQIAALLKANSRKEDVFGRMGGEEFGLLLFPGNENSLEIAERIRKQIEEKKFQYRGQEIRLTVSIGISRLSGEMDFNKAYRSSDEALYLAKKNGRNRVEMIQG